VPAVPREGTLREDGSTQLGFECPLCGNVAYVVLTPDQHTRWWTWYHAGRTGPFLQQVFPELSDRDRETLLTGTCDACFDKAFPEDPDE
jgi:hypothetical protein